MTTRLAHSPDDIAALCAQAPPAVAALLLALLEVAAQQEQTITDQAQTIATPHRPRARPRRPDSAVPRTTPISPRPAMASRSNPVPCAGAVASAPAGSPGIPARP